LPPTHKKENKMSPKPTDKTNNKEGKLITEKIAEKKSMGLKLVY
jgi:hypothetical protein